MDQPPLDPLDFDTQHVRISALIEKLKYNPENSGRVLEELEGKLAEHFAEEEALMHGIRFRGLEAHAAEHRAMTRLVSTELPAELRAAVDYPALLGVVGRFEQVYTDHIQGVDQELAVHLVRRAERERRQGSAAGPTAPARPDQG